MSAKRQAGQGIWRFAERLPPLAQRYQLSLGEGGTELLDWSGGIMLKREDTNPSGSHKDRGMAYLISYLYSLGQKNLVISSSGNAAISAHGYTQLAGLNLDVFVCPGVNPGKKGRLSNLGDRLHLDPRPLSSAFRFARDHGYFLIRPTKNPRGTDGYRTLAFEIAAEVGRITDLFLPVSSGATLLGVAAGYRQLGYLPRLHAVQPTRVCPLARQFDQDYSVDSQSITEAIVARSLLAKRELSQVIKDSGGWGWVIANKEIEQAQKLLVAAGVETANEGAMALAAVSKAKEKGLVFGKAVCLLTGVGYA